MNENEQWAPIPQDQYPKQQPQGQQFNIGKGQFDKTRLTYFFKMMLRIGYVGLAAWAFIELVNFQFDIMKFIGSQSFVYLLTFGILGWVGQLMLTGRFQPPKQDPNKKKMKWTFDPSGGRNQRPQQQHQQPQTSQTPQYPKLKPQRAPLQIQYVTCGFCKQQYPITEIRQIQKPNGAIVNVCKRCLK